MDSDKKVENKAKPFAERKGLHFLKRNGIYIISGVVLAFMLWLVLGYVQ